MFQSRISVIEGHNRDNQTDSLYDPLRKTFLLDTTAKKSYLDDVSRVSRLSHLAKIHTIEENHDLGARTLILEDAQLKPTHDLSLLPRNRNYSIINAQQKTLNPISPQEFQKRTKGNANKDEVIVYTYGNRPVNEQIPVTIEPQTPKVKQVPRRRNSLGIKVTQPKYNLFSILDQPFNNVLSGKSCTCPANELIASQKSEINWSNVKYAPDEPLI